MAEKFKGSLVGRKFIVKQDRKMSLARTPWMVAEVIGRYDWVILNFLTRGEAERLAGLLRKMGAEVEMEDRG